MQIYMFGSASYTFIYYRVYDIVCTIQNLDDVGPNEYNPELHI